jgi:glycosyltransferase involved in cell wall biosynthesis
MQDKAKIKVCLAITKGVWGGAQEYVYTLATSLPKDRYDVFVVCGEGNVLQKKLQSESVKVYTIDSLKRDVLFIQEIKSFLALKKIIKNERPDILHLNSSKMGFMGGIIGRCLSVPKIIFTAHGWAFNEERFSLLVRNIFYTIQWLTILLSDITIAVSEKTKKDTDSMPNISGKIKVVHNGVREFEILEKIEARKEIQNLSRLSENTEVIIGTISELHSNKGLDLLIESCRDLPFNSSVYIIGDGEEKVHLKELVERFHLEHKIFLVGRVENAKKYLKAFDIFTLTSRTEALPYSLLEAGLAECAVVATRVGGIPEIIEDNKNGILIHRNVSELEKVLKELIENPEKRASLGSSLRQTVSQNFSVEKMLQKTEEVYKLEP